MTSVKAIFGGDTRGFEAATNKMAAISAASARKIAANYRQELATVEKAMATLNPGSTMMPGLMARANLLNSKIAGMTPSGPSGMTGFVGGKMTRSGNLAVAGSMMASVARDSAASLASGAPISQVAMQQGPQVAQMLAMLSASESKVGLIAKGLLKWGGLIAIATGAIYGFHKATQNAFKTLFDNGSEGMAKGLARVKEGLLAARAEQDKENEAAAKRAAEFSGNQSEIVNARENMILQKALAREAQATPEERNKMILERLRGDEMVAGMEAERTAAGEFSGIQGLRLESLNAQAKYNAAKLARVMQENVIKAAEEESKPGAKQSIKTRTPATSGFFALSEWERAGGLMAGPNIQQDVSKAHYNEAKTQTRLLTEIKTRLRGGATF